MVSAGKIKKPAHFPVHAPLVKLLRAAIESHLSSHILTQVAPLTGVRSCLEPKDILQTTLVTKPDEGSA